MKLVWEEIMKIVKLMQMGQAAGCDRVSSKTLKNDDGKMKTETGSKINLPGADFLSLGHYYQDNRHGLEETQIGVRASAPSGQTG
ncbi:hypothetical protein EVAR_84403_1 [Eumeta japonica]|uniref:Uncharacterized protein n=1 Tax=Eumeta variegata TaxID=151549 RepID=A0A4C1YD93_EUMVA|nr:hypothetical protein EVAR_84403_1 [Eumeta japonica]